MCKDHPNRLPLGIIGQASNFGAITEVATKNYPNDDSFYLQLTGSWKQSDAFFTEKDKHSVFAKRHWHFRLPCPSGKCELFMDKRSPESKCEMCNDEYWILFSRDSVYTKWAREKGLMVNELPEWEE